MSGHEYVVLTADLNSDGKIMIQKIKNIAKTENMMFATKDVRIRFLKNDIIRTEIEACNSKTQVLADNFENPNVFRVYVRSPTKKPNADSKRIIRYIN